MRLTFVLPGLPRRPVGGYRVIYEYASRLAQRGHEVTVTHPRVLPPVGFRVRLRAAAAGANDALLRPSVAWHSIDPRVRFLLPWRRSARALPPANAIFATAWFTVPLVLAAAPECGKKFYFIQHYETWSGPKPLVDETWRAPLHKIVIAKWLLELARQFGDEDVAYVPNAIDREKFRLVAPIDGRPRRVAMMYSDLPFKGARVGLAAVELARQRFPDLAVVLFGTGPAPEGLPPGVEYYRDPPHDVLLRQIYNGSSIFLAPSLSEGLAAPPAEAACCGCAIVGSDIGGIAEYFRPGVSALLAPAGDAPALAAHLCRLLADDSERVGFAQAAYADTANLDWDRSTSQLEAAIAARTGPSRPGDADCPATCDGNR